MFLKKWQLTFFFPLLVLLLSFLAGSGCSSADRITPSEGETTPQDPDADNGTDDDNSDDGTDDTEESGNSPSSDDDGDGYTELDGDCDDANSSIYPSAEEVFDLADTDCDGTNDSSFDLANATAFILGEDTNYGFGGHVVSGGDINGDGRDDFLVCAIEGDFDTDDDSVWFKVYLFYGSDNLTGSILAADADIIFKGTNFYDLMSISTVPGSVGMAGDVDGDGFGDVLIGSILNQDDGGERTGSKVYLFYGSDIVADTDGLIRTDSAGVTYTSSDTVEAIGYASTGAGDVNGDGCGDYLLQSTEGIFLIYGSGSCNMQTRANGTIALNTDQFDALVNNHFSSLTADDINGDGYADLILGSYDYDTGEENTNEGKVYVIFGGKHGTSDELTGVIDADVEADATFVGQASFDYAGKYVTTGDVNGDGYNDLVISAYKHNETESDEVGAVYVILGSATISGSLEPDYIFVGQETGENMGGSIASGDINGDGKSEVLFKGGVAPSVGKLYLILADHIADENALSQAITWVGENEGDNFGSITTGDLDGNGRSDLLIGASGYDSTSASTVGGVYVIYSY